MTKGTYTLDTNCTAQIYEQANANQKSENFIWGSLIRLAGTIGEYALEMYRYNNNPEPVLSNGGTRVLIRPNRIDLV